MPYQELPGLGQRGLNTDMPSQALDHTSFSAGKNLRPFDGSIQTVHAFNSGTPATQSIAPIGPNAPDEVDRRDIYAFTHWIQTGASEFRAAYVYKSGDDSWEIQVINDVTGEGDEVRGSTSVNSPIVQNPRWGIQLLAFNGVLMLNDGSPGGPDFFTLSNDADAVPTNIGFSDGWLGNTVSCERVIPYKGRLVALNIDGEYLDDTLGNSTIVWSTPITELNSINGVTFKFTASNSAGDDILADTPGEVLDGGALGQYLIIYKDDAVYRYTDIGAPLFLVGEPLYIDDGLLSPDCWSDIGGGRHFVVGNFGCYIHDGGPNKQNVSRGRIQKALYSEFNDEMIDKDRTFTFHQQNDKEVWVCIPEKDKAYVYNYEIDTWYMRDLLENTRGITSIQQNGKLYNYAFRGLDEAEEYQDLAILSSERDDPRYLAGDMEFHYMTFGDNSKIKHLHEVYPHTSNTVKVTFDTTNNLGSPIVFHEDDTRLFDATNGENYKVDYRTQGRYYHLKVESDETTNPELTGLGFEIAFGGQR